MDIYRIIDANLNRAREGLRVIEEICRFYLNDKEKFLKLKELRHLLQEGEKNLKINPVLFRKSETDVGREFSQLESKRTDLKEILKANSKRVQESLRVLEEFSKLYTDSVEIFKKARFSIYQLEKDIILELSKMIDYSLYLITDDIYLKNHDIFNILEKCFEAGVTVFQYRAKEKTSLEMFREAEKLRRLTNKYGIPLIINDRLDLALAVEADGVHLGQDDLPIGVAKRCLGDKIIGISNNHYNQAKEAILNKADYIGVGPVFKTMTKKDAKPVCGVKPIMQIKNEFPNAKVVGIGGITLDNAVEVLRAGADGVAVISGILGSEDPVKTTGLFRKLIDDFRKADEKFDTNVES